MTQANTIDQILDPKLDLVDDGDDDMALHEHDGADAEEENDLDDAEEEVDAGHLAEDVLTGEDEQEDVEGDDQLAPEVEGMGLFAAEVADGVGQDEEAGGDVEPCTTTFEPFERGGDDG